MPSSTLGQPTTPSERPSGEIPIAGGSSRVESPGRLEEQPTVISQTPPLTPAELGGRSDRLQPGTRLEHFEILELIGGGGMAQVYRARDTGLDRIVAVKVLTAEHAAEPETRQRFQNEAKSAAQLDHENIARVYYVGEDQGSPFIVYEYIQGTNLRAMVERRGPLPLAEAVHYALQVAEALVHAS
ncbi:MAG TPA: serine/threonine-protein kinase, partial [Thermoguttaceae bacterium]|nr:serine/threonine-protein kinase [Thermoguttaceae bacterium]